MNTTELLLAISTSVNAIFVGLGLCIYYRNIAKEDTIKLKDATIEQKDTVIEEKDIVIKKKDEQINAIIQELDEAKRDMIIAREYRKFARAQGEIIARASIVKETIQPV